MCLGEVYYLGKFLNKSFQVILHCALRGILNDVGHEFSVTSLDATTIDGGYGTTLDSPSKRHWTRIFISSETMYNIIVHSSMYM